MARRKSGQVPPPKTKAGLRFPLAPLGHSSPRHCPTRCPQSPTAESLGKPLGIRETSQLIGCSPWTVRQKLIPSGLPVFRSGAGGKLIFYRDQVVRWLHGQQGGNA